MTANDNAADANQLAAADPAASVWLHANAGSGKTKVLIDRVARLLLSGVEPQHILCLTYTKAAAAEMQNRLFKRLGAWAMMPDETLGNALAALGPLENSKAPEMTRARQLFARAIETPGGLRCCGAFRLRPGSARISASWMNVRPSFCDPSLRRKLRAGHMQLPSMGLRGSTRLMTWMICWPGWLALAAVRTSFLMKVLRVRCLACAPMKRWKACWLMCFWGVRRGCLQRFCL
jgi:hypothetical protein